MILCDASLNVHVFQHSKWSQSIVTISRLHVTELKILGHFVRS